MSLNPVGNSLGCTLYLSTSELKIIIAKTWMPLLFPCFFDPLSWEGCGSPAAVLAAGKLHPWVQGGCCWGSGRAQGEKKRPSCHLLHGDVTVLGRKLLLRGCSQTALSRMKPGCGGAGSAPLPCGSVRESPAVGALLRAFQRKKGKKKHLLWL